MDVASGSEFRPDDKLGKAMIETIEALSRSSDLFVVIEKDNWVDQGNK